MKIYSLQENLKAGLLKVSHLAGKNINLPILNNVLIKADENNIKLITTNLEIGIVCEVRGKIEKEGAFTVDSRLLTDCISLLPNKKIGLEQKEGNLVVDGENFKVKIKGQLADEFPLIPTVERNKPYILETEAFKKALSQAVFAVSTAESRLELTGVLFSFLGNQLILTATDSYRLAEKKVNLISNNKEERKVIVPPKTLQELLRILTTSQQDEMEEQKQIEFYLSDNQILFHYGTTDLISRLIEGQYPDYQQIIPTVSKTRVIIERTELVRAAKMASLFSKTGINDINLDFPAGKNQLIISSISSQTGENITTLPAKTSGPDNSIVLNFRYLLDGLNNIDSEMVKLEIIDANTPCLLRPEKENDYLYIIMPIKQ